MNNLITYLFLFFFINIFGQNKSDSIYVQEETRYDSEEYEVKSISDSSKFHLNETIIERKFEPNFKEKYNDKIFEYIKKPKPKNAWNDFKEWLNALLNSFFNSTNKNKSNYAEWIINILAILIIVVVIYFIIKALKNNETQWIFGKNSKNNVLETEDYEKNIHETNFEELINKTINNNEVRLTIRYYYLWSLKKLAQNKYITWDIEKTNSDYLHEIKSPKIKADFEYISYLYNNIWYGEYELDTENYKKIINSFKQFLQFI